MEGAAETESLERKQVGWVISDSERPLGWSLWPKSEVTSAVALGGKG